MEGDQHRVNLTSSHLPNSTLVFGIVDGFNFTNLEYYNYLTPNQPYQPYVYDHFRWEHCGALGYPIARSEAMFKSTDLHDNLALQAARTVANLLSDDTASSDDAAFTGETSHGASTAHGESSVSHHAGHQHSDSTDGHKYADGHSGYDHQRKDNPEDDDDSVPTDEQAMQPHIVMITLDDVGMNDLDLEEVLRGVF